MDLKLMKRLIPILSVAILASIICVSESKAQGQREIKSVSPKSVLVVGLFPEMEYVAPFKNPRREMKAVLLGVFPSMEAAQRGTFQGIVNTPPPAAAGDSSYTYRTSSVTGCYNDVGGGGTVCKIALHQTPNAGDLLLCGAVWQSGSATASLADTPNGTYTAIGSIQVGSGGTAGFSSQMFKVSSTANSAATPIMTVSGTVAFLDFQCAEYIPSGTITADGSAYSKTAASGGVATVGPISTGGATDLIFAVCMLVDTACSAGSGFTSHVDTSGFHCTNALCTTGGTATFADTGGLIEEKLNVASGSNSATFGMGATDNNMLGEAAFR
jgi:hypothetical protein